VPEVPAELLEVTLGKETATIDEALSKTLNLPVGVVSRQQFRDAIVEYHLKMGDPSMPL
jgi:hypothetical protein